MVLDPNKEDKRMARKRFKPEEIVARLRQVKHLFGLSGSMPTGCDTLTRCSVLLV